MKMLFSSLDHATDMDAPQRGGRVVSTDPVVNQKRVVGVASGGGWRVGIGSLLSLLASPLSRALRYLSGAQTSEGSRSFLRRYPQVVPSHMVNSEYESLRDELWV